MAFRTRASIDPNNHKGIIVQNSNGLGGLLVPTGRSSAGAISIDVSVVDASGNQITSFGSAAKPTVNTTASIASSATAVTLIASNTGRLGVTVYNDSTALLYIKLGAAASLTDFTEILQVITNGIGGYYEVPFGYTGIITGIWASANGFARAGELT